MRLFSIYQFINFSHSLLRTQIHFHPQTKHSANFFRTTISEMKDNKYTNIQSKLSESPPHELSHSFNPHSNRTDKRDKESVKDLIISQGIKQASLARV